MKSLFANLRFRLMLLVLLAIMPVLGLTFFTGLEQRQAAGLAAQHSALRLVWVLAEDQGRLIESTRQLLITLTQLSEIRRDAATACAPLLANLRQQYPLYANLGLTDRNGDLLCSAVPASGPVNYADRAWFQDVLRTRDFVVGGYVLGKVPSKPVASFAYPLLDAAGQVQAVVFAGLDLAWLNRFVVGVELPAGSVLTVIDSAGTILARSSEPEQWVGRTAPEAPIIQAILTRPSRNQTG
jgi:hypothetical protein